ncbi:ABC transporter permease [Paenibacillus sp. EPM92]|uniref:ABC transporter permease n=1 Tax=Paenibacillus sp. EPM92 TaxID=1561195 RepID=UPI0019154177|nr:ABC transporter permease subunit [Paenibacillus sp. EPM92]
MKLFDHKSLRPILTVVWVFVLIICWEVAAWLMQDVFQVKAAQSKLPYLHDVLIAMVQNVATLSEQGMITFGNAVIGFILGSIIGLLLAVLLSVSTTVKYTVSPYIISSQMIPIMGLAPIVFGILQNADVARIMMAAYVTFFPVTINSLHGLESTRSERLELMRSYAASSWKTYTKLKLVSALPGLFAGLKVAAPLAVTASIVVEMMGAPEGIGVLMLSSLYYGSAQNGMFWSTILTSMIIGIASFIFIVFIEKFTTSWQPEFRKERREAA